MRKGKIVVDQALAMRADVYLGMWKALESFDPNQDRWSEPTDFGSQHERIRSAENAIAAIESRYPGSVDDAVREDIRRFRQSITGLINGGVTFTGRVADFCDRLGEVGVELAYSSLKQAGAAGRSQ
jgi:hypothetical protein